jgi:class 3 adenylate cyclase
MQRSDETGVPISMDGKGREARQLLIRYLTYYNDERPHQALNYQTSREVYYRFAANECGESQVSITRRRTPIPEERKLVTILFADVTGSTALGEALDPEDVRALMGRYYQHARQVMLDHGGTLEKFIGDAVMAIFGLPQAHGNDPERALVAALALRSALADDALLTGRLLLRIGVNTGEVVATRDASASDFLVTGDAVNVAARLQQAATPGEILVGDRTAAASVVAFHFGAARATLVKGKSQPLTVFPLVGLRPTRAPSRPQFVGRRRELAQLDLLREAVLEEHHPQLVSIVAPAGTGKTRLLEEFLARLDPAEGWQVATARCPPYGQTLNFWPLRGLLDELLGEHYSLERVAEVFTVGGHADADSVRLAEFVLAALGIEPEEPTQRESIFNAWRLFIEARARQAPLIVVFEDLHWASESLLDLVEHVTHPRTNAALLILVLSRPELLDRRPSWGGGRRSFTALDLGALRDAQTRQLVDQLVPELASPAVRTRIVERSGGNPFFAIELAQGLTERLADPADASNTGADMLPDTVYEALLARLDQLAEPEREALQVAAVAGRTFRLPTLVAALPERDPTTIATALEGLLLRDLVMPSEGEEEAYTFRHILFRDVAYGTLARAERVRLHVAVAQWLEGYARDRLDEFVELLAYHYREAATLARQAAVPLGVEVDTAQAVHYLVRAGTLASRAGMLAPAVDHLRAAIALAPEEEHPQLYEQLGDCAFSGDAALEGYQHALDLWRKGDKLDPLTGARLLRKLIYIYRAWGSSYSVPLDPEEVAVLHAEALRLAEQAADEDELWRVRMAPLNGIIQEGSREELERDRDLFTAAAAYFEHRQDWPGLYVALDGLAGYMQRLGAFEEARTTSKRCLDWPDLPVWARGNVQFMLVFTYAVQGENDACIATAQSALAQLRPGDPLAPLADAVGLAAIAAYLCGRWSELDELQQALALIWDELQQVPGLHAPWMWGSNLVNLLVAVAREDRVAADAAAGLLDRLVLPTAPDAAVRRSIIAAIHMDDPTRIQLDGIVYVPIQRTLTLAYVAEHGLPAPARLIQEIRDMAGDVNKVVADTAEALACGDDVRLAAAIDTAEVHHLIPHAARMRIVLAQRTGDSTPLARARPVLERLADRQFLRRLEEVQRALA